MASARPAPDGRHRAASCRTVDEQASLGQGPQGQIISGASMGHKAGPVKQAPARPFPPAREFAKVKGVRRVALVQHPAFTSGWPGLESSEAPE
jgi:hypothetical protein